MTAGLRPILDMVPTEVMIQIVRSVPDLATLHHLTLASPRVFRIFNRYGMTILESVMINDTPPEIRSLVRLVAQVHACTPETPMASTYEEFLEKYIIYRSEKSGSYRDSRDGSVEFEHFDGTPLPEIGGEWAYSPRDILLLLRHVAILSEACIDFFRNRLQFYVHNSMNDYPGILPKLKQYYQLDNRPHSWTETQRMRRGLWQFQLHHEVKDAIMNGHINWMSVGKKADSIRLHAFYESWESQEWEVYSVVYFLRKSFCRNVEEFYFSYEYCISGDGRKPRYGTHLKDITLNRALKWPATAQWPPSNRLENPEGRIQGAPLDGYFTSLLRSRHHWVPNTYLLRNTFKYLFKFGFAIWDESLSSE